MAKHLYVFIDESGDPGYAIGETGASSAHYAELALQIDDEGLVDFLTHIISWRYCQGRFYESKTLPKGRALARYINPIREIHCRGNLHISCVYLIKEHYTGPYLKPSPATNQNPIFFRNFIHKKLLEFHFGKSSPAKEAEIHLIFDRYTMSRELSRNMKDYLHNNWNLPDFEHICHADSIYTEALQVASQLLIAVKDIILQIANNETQNLLNFIAMKDITSFRSRGYE